MGVRADPRTGQILASTVQNFVYNIQESKQTSIRKSGWQTQSRFRVGPGISAEEFHADNSQLRLPKQRREDMVGSQEIRPDTGGE